MRNRMLAVCLAASALLLASGNGTHPVSAPSAAAGHPEGAGGDSALRLARRTPPDDPKPPPRPKRDWAPAVERVPGRVGEPKPPPARGAEGRLA